MDEAFEGRVREPFTSLRVRVHEVHVLPDELGVATVVVGLEAVHGDAHLRCDVTEVRAVGEVLGPEVVRPFAPPWTLLRHLMEKRDACHRGELRLAWKR